jgi:cell wall-associated NlpC family hydrolase
MPPLRPNTAAVRVAIGTLALALLASPSQAAPGDVADPVLQLLADKHLIGTITDPRPAPARTVAAVGLLQRMQDRTAELVLVALNAVGVRYRHGGNSEASGFDCSGFTRYVFGSSLGLMLPRSADEQAAAPTLLAVRREDLQPGDLVFFNTLRRTFSHVGIYIGDNRFVHAPSAGGEVRTEDMGFAYWKKRYTGARRALSVAQAPDTSADPAVAPEPR